jgi:hypothetical protein
MPSAEQCLPDARGCMPSAEQCLPDARGCMHSAEQCLPDARGCMPSAEQCLPDARGCMPSAEQCLPDARRCMSSAEQCLPYVRNTCPTPITACQIRQRSDRCYRQYLAWDAVRASIGHCFPKIRERILNSVIFPFAGRLKLPLAG